MAVKRDYLGSIWNPIFPANKFSGFNFTIGEDIVPALIMNLLLTTQGENPLNPGYGLKPELFGAIEDLDPDYWANVVADAIWKWVPGLAGIQIEMSADSFNGKIAAQITYRAQNAFSANLLVFPYHLYNGSIYYEDIDTFVQGITLNGQPFTGVR